jgi:hypothetical protein
VYQVNSERTAGRLITHCPAATGSAARIVRGTIDIPGRLALRRRMSQRAQHRALLRQAQESGAVAARYDKPEFMYQGTVDLAPIRICLRDPLP